MTPRCAFKVPAGLSPAEVLGEDMGTCPVQRACLRQARQSCVWCPLTRAAVQALAQPHRDWGERLLLA